MKRLSGKLTTFATALALSAVLTGGLHSQTAQPTSPVGAPLATAVPGATPVAQNAGVLAGEIMPRSYYLNGITHIYQTWNNCGPATITMGLSYFGASADQNPAAQWLKPNSEDKNVSPWQIVQYVNEELDTSTRAVLRQGGDVDLLRTLIANEFPVMIEAGYDPESDDQGWMGHYLLMTAYDDGLQTFYAQDSFGGPNRAYTYDYTNDFWRHFNRVYIVLYPITREAELAMLLGDDWDETANVQNALDVALTEANANPQDAFAWFNIGTNLVLQERYTEAAPYYDQARNLGLPFRMMWYQFGIFEAYLNTGRYNDVIALAQANLNDGGGQYVEETFYYGGRARAGLGETERAISNFDQAIFFNPNFTPAIEARAELTGA